MEIRPIDFADPRVLALLAEHLSGMRGNSPPEHVHALDVSGLQHPSVTFVGAWQGEELLAFGAIKQLTSDQGEIKSMRTAAPHLRKGAAAFILKHLLEIARERGYRRVSLETGRGDVFEPALALYRRRGFVEGPPFAGYTANAFSQFFHLDL